MSTTRHLVQTDSRGIVSGTAFDDRDIIQNLGQATVCQIDVAHADYINSITVGVYVRLQSDTG